METANHVYGLVGYRLAHSFSRNFFNEKFENEKIPAEYRNFELDRIEDLRLVVEETPELCGLNVTIPYKESIIPLLDEMDGTAQMIGAVNVVKVIHDKDKVVLKGYNSDIIGFTESIRPYIKEYHHKALVLGTGGASKAVRYGLLSLGIEPQLVSRTAREGVLTYDDLPPQLMGEYQIIVNATPVGMYPQTDTCPNIPYEALTSRHLAYDLVYNPETTLFLEKCAAQGAVIKNGLEMLLLQAYASWDIWNK